MKKQNLLDAWIMIERFSEGDIPNNSKKIIITDDNYSDFFQNILNKNKANKDSGFLIYFESFIFNEIVEIIKKNYGLSDAYDEIVQSKRKKFKFALKFDEKLKLDGKKTFFSVPGMVKDTGKLAANFYELEENEKEKVNAYFDSFSFDEAIRLIVKEYNIKKNMLHYEYLNDVKKEGNLFHSFIISDLERAKKIDTANLERYINGYNGFRINLDENINPQVFTEILRPINYPLGRYIASPQFPLSIMQQVSVNLALNDKNSIRSVNGPPGTGKTTLLKDIFSDLLVQQAYEICNLKLKKINKYLYYDKGKKLAILPPSISDKGIVVASSNNGAVQNIIEEFSLLPKGLGNKSKNNNKKETLFEEHIRQQLINADYFLDIANNNYDMDDNKYEKLKYFGPVSLQGGRKSNINNLTDKIKKIKNHLENSNENNSDVYSDFLAKYNYVRGYKEKQQELSEVYEEYKKLLEFNQKTDIEKINSEETILNHKIKDLESKELRKKNEYDFLINSKPFFLCINKRKKHIEKLQQSIQLLNMLSEQIQLLRKKQINIVESMKSYKDNQEKIQHLQKNYDFTDSKFLNFNKDRNEFQKSNPWFNKEYRELQTELFISSLIVRKQFLYENKENLSVVTEIWNTLYKFPQKTNGNLIIQTAWNWMNFIIPIIGTTFASFGYMFRYLGENSIANTFIDEGGQATPQSSVGAVFRSKKIMAVGDPSQIPPVNTVDASIKGIICQIFNINELYISNDSSTQALFDRTVQFGFEKKDQSWIGVPLWVHRRCCEPMFSLSNILSYDKLMVQGKSKKISQGKAKWFDVKGNAENKFVLEQAVFVKEKIIELWETNPSLIDEDKGIFIITPFRYVSEKLSQYLKNDVEIRKYKNEKATDNIGTVHKFQGKEAKIVFFVLGADKSSEEAARWAFSTANLVNVAVTRAKEEFYIVGDKKLYMSLDNDNVNKTASFI